jgi:hypothetical protein
VDRLTLNVTMRDARPQLSSPAPFIERRAVAFA